MSNGIINPKGRRNLYSTTRDLTPQYQNETDRSLGLSDHDPNSYIKYVPIKELPKKDSPTITQIRRNKERREKLRKEINSERINNAKS
jgi:hypothetical protein